MNLILVIVVLVLAWMVYMYMQSYESIAKELREIRLKCLQTPTVSLSETAMHPMNAMRRQLVQGLQTIQSQTTGTGNRGNGRPRPQRAILAGTPPRRPQ
jgi:hypothetical protein